MRDLRSEYLNKSQCLHPCVREITARAIARKKSLHVQMCTVFLHTKSGVHARA